MSVNICQAILKQPEFVVYCESEPTSEATEAVKWGHCWGMKGLWADVTKVCLWNCIPDIPDPYCSQSHLWNLYSSESPCGGLNENSSPSYTWLIYLNVWSVVGKTIWEGLGGVML